MGESRHAHIFPAVVSKLRMRSQVSPQRASLVGGLLLAGFAYRDLLVFEPNRGIPDPAERLLFEPADTTPALIVALALWLLYRRRDRWGRLPRGSGPLWLTLPLLAAGAAVLIWARLTGAHDLLALSLLASGLGLASLGKGIAGVRVLLLPAFFLLFALPLPPAFSNAVIFRFQLWTAAIAGQFLFVLGLPARVVGESVLRSDFTFLVIEGCSGLRSVVTLSMLAVLMVDLFRRRPLHAVIVVLAAPFVAFGFNAVRAVALILNPHSSLASVHVAQGVAILLCGLLVLYALDGLLAHLLPRVASPAAPSPHAPVSQGHTGVALAFLVLLAVLPVATTRWVALGPVPMDLERRFAQVLTEWTVTPLETDRVFLGSVSFRDSHFARYQLGGESVDLFLGIGYRAQRFSSLLSPKTEVPGTGWIVEERGRARPGSSDRDIDVLVERSATRRLLVYHWVDGSSGLLSEALRSLLALDATPWCQSRDPLVVRIATEIEGPGAEERRQAEARLEQFIVSLRAGLDRLIRDMDAYAADSGGKRFS